MQDAKAASAVRYFFGRISRDEAEEALQSAGIREGLYLLRESIMKAGDYVLSICHEAGYVTNVTNILCAHSGGGYREDRDGLWSLLLKHWCFHFTRVNILDSSQQGSNLAEKLRTCV